jgi:predicted DCC family thiol-disulfide oxidoreductase YuxK
VKAGALVVFDGVCNLCDASVRFIAAHDSGGSFRLAPMQSEAAQAALAQFGQDGRDLQGVVLVEGGRVFTGSDAALRIAAELEWPWTLGRFLLAVPRGPREALYGFVARNRYRWFGKRDTCAVPSEETTRRFAGRLAERERRLIPCCEAANQDPEVLDRALEWCRLTRAVAKERFEKRLGVVSPQDYFTVFRLPPPTGSSGGCTNVMPMFGM